MNETMAWRHCFREVLEVSPELCLGQVFESKRLSFGKQGISMCFLLGGGVKDMATNIVACKMLIVCMHNLYRSLYHSFPVVIHNMIMGSCYSAPPVEVTALFLRWFLLARSFKHICGLKAEYLKVGVLNHTFILHPGRQMRLHLAPRKARL